MASIWVATLYRLIILIILQVHECVYRDPNNDKGVCGHAVMCIDLYCHDSYHLHGIRKNHSHPQSGVLLKATQY